MEWRKPWRSRIAATASLSPPSVCAGDQRRLNTACSSPGMTLVAPVPDWTLLTWKLVGGKCTSPASHFRAASSVNAGSAAWIGMPATCIFRSEEHTSELQSQSNLVCRLLLEKKKKKKNTQMKQKKK